MNYISSWSENTLKTAFREDGINLDIKSTYIVAKNSRPYTDAKIQEVIKSCGFCPLLSENRSKGDVVFTIVPYTIPSFFAKDQPGLYFPKEDLMQFMTPNRFTPLMEGDFKDRWISVNRYRTPVAPALNKGLSEIIRKHASHGNPILEIGSGIGYSLSEDLSSKTIRTQADDTECQLLSNSITNPIYKTDIEGIYNTLFENGAKISLFFALNVFDTLSSSKRKTSFEQMSRLQNTGDRILIMLDTNPYLNEIYDHIAALYPNYVLIPYSSLGNRPAKTSVLLMPVREDLKPTTEELINTQLLYSNEVANRMISKDQLTAHALQERYDLKVINLESFFAEHVQRELEESGYSTNSYYHAAFSISDMPKDTLEIKQDIIYKPVTDSVGALRQWALEDNLLATSLSEKRLRLPEELTKEFSLYIKENKKTYCGAEILVIEAIKT